MQEAKRAKSRSISCKREIFRWQRRSEIHAKGFERCFARKGSVESGTGGRDAAIATEATATATTISTSVKAPRRDGGLESASPLDLFAGQKQTNKPPPAPRGAGGGSLEGGIFTGFRRPAAVPPPAFKISTG